MLQASTLNLHQLHSYNHITFIHSQLTLAQLAYVHTKLTYKKPKLYPQVTYFHFIHIAFIGTQLAFTSMGLISEIN